MKLFTQLYVELDQTNKTNEKVEAMRFYFGRAAPADAAWAFYFLSGRKPRQIVPSKICWTRKTKRCWSTGTKGSWSTGIKGMKGMKMVRAMCYWIDPFYPLYPCKNQI